MLLVKGLDEAVKKFNGEDINAPDGKKITFKKVLVDQLGAFGAGADPQRGRVNGEQMIKAYDLGAKIHNAGTEVELDSEQAKFINKAISSNPLYSALIVGQVLKRLSEAKEEPKAVDNTDKAPVAQ